MSAVPWWAYSPNPVTFVIYGLMALYGAYRMKSLNFRDWVGKLTLSFFVVGLVVLPFDLIWTVDQALVFGHLYPNDLVELFPLFNLKLSYWFLCFLETYKLFKEKSFLELRNLFYIFFYIPYLVLVFKLSPGPSWTDWTYGLRFGHSNWLQIYIFGLFTGKPLQVAVFWNLWRKQK